MLDPDFRSNYTRALRAAVKGDTRSLVAALRNKVPLYPADMAMLADFIAGKFRPKAKPNHRPKKTMVDFVTSNEVNDIATMHYWREAEARRVEGRRDGTLGDLSDTVAELYGIENHRFPTIRSKRRRFNPFKRPAPK